MAKYSTKPRPDILTAAQSHLGKPRYELMRLRDEAVKQRDWQLMQALTYALSLLPVQRAS